MNRRYFILILILILLAAGTFLTLQNPSEFKIKKPTPSGEPDISSESESRQIFKPPLSIPPEIKNYKITLTPEGILPGSLALCPKDKLELTFRNLTRVPYLAELKEFDFSYGPLETGQTRTVRYQLPEETGIFNLAFKPVNAPQEPEFLLSLMVGQAPRPELEPDLEIELPAVPEISCPDLPF